MLRTLPVFTGKVAEEVGALDATIVTSPVTLRGARYEVPSVEEGLDTVVELLTTDEGHAFIMTIDGLDSVCYRLDRCPPVSYMLDCPPWLRQKNMQHWLGLARTDLLSAYSAPTTEVGQTGTETGLLVSIVTKEHSPISTGLLVNLAKIYGGTFLKYRWSPTKCRFDVQLDEMVSLRTSNSPTGFGTVVVSAGVKLEGVSREVRIPGGEHLVHRWKDLSELQQEYNVMLRAAVDAARALEVQWQKILRLNPELKVDWQEAMHTAAELLGSRGMPLREIKRHLPESGSPGTWRGLIAFFMEIAVILEQDRKEDLAEQVELAAGRLVAIAAMS